MWHHLGSVPAGFGAAFKATRIADWIDLLTPYVVLAPALLALLATAPSTRRLVWFSVGSWMYADGHGVHLSANSVGKSPGLIDPAGTAHTCAMSTSGTTSDSLASGWSLRHLP